MNPPLRPLLLLLASSWLSAALALHGAAPAPDWNVCDHIAREDFIIQSHRGAGFLAEENTLHAFELGWSLGTYPEADVRTTKDGVIVAFHDPDFSRVVRNPPPDLKNKTVRNVTFAELSPLEVGRWDGGRFIGHSVPRLAEVFAAMRGHPERHLYLDIKDVDLVQLAEEVRAHDVGAQVVLAAPRPETIRRWKELVPGSATLLWMGGSEEDLRARVEGLKASGFGGITQLQIHIRLRPAPDGSTPDPVAAGPDPFTLSDAFIVELGRELRARGILYPSLHYTADPAV